MFRSLVFVDVQDQYIKWYMFISIGIIFWSMVNLIGYLKNFSMSTLVQKFNYDLLEICRVE